jgi:hypothetical protein
MGDANAKAGQETVHQPMIGKHSLHESTHENGLRLVDFAAGRQIAIDRRKTRRGAYIDSDHMLVVIKLRARICHASNTNPQQLRRFVVDGLKDRDVASRVYDELESELQGVQAQPLSLDEKSKKLEETIQRVARNTIGYTRKQANKSGLTRSVQGRTKKRTSPESEPSKSKPKEPRMLKN